jgi:cystathionine beta-lyase/cystathionine gamma-synthase
VQNPLAQIDIVLHGTTKYLNGHSDIIGGMLITSDEKFTMNPLHTNAAGGVPSPFDCWLVLVQQNSGFRMKQIRKCKTFANFFQIRFAKKVIYPGLKDHPQHDLAKKQMRGFGGMVSADFGTIDKAKKVLNNVKIFTLAESLGGSKA